MTDLTHLVAPDDTGRNTVLLFLIDGEPHSVRLPDDVDPATLWAEAASAAANKLATPGASVAFDAANNDIVLSSPDGTAQTVKVELP